MSAPRAAVGTFPYPHRTIEQIDAAERERVAIVAKCSANKRGPGDRLSEMVGEPKDRARFTDVTAFRATLPDAPCHRCGARGWCDHRRAAA